MVIHHYSFVNIYGQLIMKELVFLFSSISFTSSSINKELPKIYLHYRWFEFVIIHPSLPGHSLSQSWKYLVIPRRHCSQDFNKINFKYILTLYNNNETCCRRTTQLNGFFIRYLGRNAILQPTTATSDQTYAPFESIKSI